MPLPPIRAASALFAGASYPPALID